jgi:hypothetical protein
MSKMYETDVQFYIDGERVGGTTISVCNGKIDTQAAEDEFYGMLRKHENSIIAAAEQFEHDYIVSHLTPDDEIKLKAAHADQYHGTDDDMPDDYEAWLSDQNTQDIKKIIHSL